MAPETATVELTREEINLLSGLTFRESFPGVMGENREPRSGTAVAIDRALWCLHGRLSGHLADLMDAGETGVDLLPQPDEPDEGWDPRE
jgi:hypothetical protein